MPPTKKPAGKDKKLDKEPQVAAKGKKPASSDGKGGKAPAKKPAVAAKPAAKSKAPAKKPKLGQAAAEAAAVETLAAHLDPDGDDGAEQYVDPNAKTRVAIPLPASALEDELEQAKTRIAIALPPMTEEEQELSSLYGGELVPAGAAHAEFADRQTADEDRPMTPEINARDERKNRWQDRRDQRRQRRDDRQRTGGGGGNGQPHAQPAGGQPQHGGGGHREPRPPQFQNPRPPLTTVPATPGAVNGHTNGNGNGAVAPAALPVGELDPHARVGTPLGDAAAQVFAQLRNGQPMPVRQLAQMMRKRNLVTVDPEQLWPQLKAELLGDERSYRALGLRPRIVYRGRDLFGPGAVAMSQTADAEGGVAVALSRLAGATHRALAGRVGKASPAGFERLIHAYLVGAGYRDIEWVKRLSGISYASATAPGIERAVLISARSGDSPIDRRGIGELRVGVEAKNLVAGILFSAGTLSDDAEAELERAGRSIAVVCGDQLVAALVATGVGVVSAAAPLHYVDDQLLDELLAG